jgi:hypothetical protein
MSVKKKLLDIRENKIEKKKEEMNKHTRMVIFTENKTNI